MKSKTLCRSIIFLFLLLAPSALCDEEYSDTEDPLYIHPRFCEDSLKKFCLETETTLLAAAQSNKTFTLQERIKILNEFLEPRNLLHKQMKLMSTPHGALGAFIVENLKIGDHLMKLNFSMLFHDRTVSPNHFLSHATLPNIHTLEQRLSSLTSESRLFFSFVFHAANWEVSVFKDWLMLLPSRSESLLTRLTPYELHLLKGDVIEPVIYEYRERVRGAYKKANEEIKKQFPAQELKTLLRNQVYSFSDFILFEYLNKIIGFEDQSNGGSLFWVPSADLLLHKVDVKFDNEFPFEFRKHYSVSGEGPEKVFTLTADRVYSKGNTMFRGFSKSTYESLVEIGKIPRFDYSDCFELEFISPSTLILLHPKLREMIDAFENVTGKTCLAKNDFSFNKTSTFNILLNLGTVEAITKCYEEVFLPGKTLPKLDQLKNLAKRCEPFISIRKRRNLFKSTIEFLNDRSQFYETRLKEAEQYLQKRKEAKLDFRSGELIAVYFDERRSVSKAIQNRYLELSPEHKPKDEL